MASNPTARADKLRDDATKALNRTSFFGFGKKGQIEEAAELYKQAGNAYKLANSFQTAGDVFLQAADNYAKADNPTDASSCIVEAAQCYKKVNPADSVVAYRRAIDVYNEAGRFGMSSRYAKEMAEVYEADNNKEAACAAYEEAADLFEKDNKPSNKNQCIVKVATYKAEAGDVGGAARLYEDLGRSSMQSRLGAYSAKGYFFQALLCYLALNDQVQVSKKINEFSSLDHTFNGSRECDFINKLLKASEDMDLEGFANACADFDRITPLDPWKTSMLIKVKKFIQDAVGDEEPDLA